MSERLLPIPEGLVGERADIALGRLLGMSRSQATALLLAGDVLLDGQPLGKSDRLPADGLLAVTLRPVEPVTPPQSVPGLVIRYEDEDIVVVEKPAGVAAHPSPGWNGPTVTEGLAASGVLLADAGAAERKGVVHRLDVGTSGLMVLAKSELAYRSLKQAFKERTVHKEYHAVVQGRMDPLRGTIDAPVGRDRRADYRFAVTRDGRPAVTHYETQEAFPHASLLRIELETGRTHQIRVHCAAMRHPCVGDRTYGADPQLADQLGLDRQWLHATSLGFEHPRTHEQLTFTSAPADDLAQALSTLRAMGE
jgi:23S rRNA pseudouridine1911/1915/1917 synthase